MNKIVIGGVVVGSVTVIGGVVVGVNAVVKSRKACKDAAMEVTIKVTDGILNILDSVIKESPFVEYENVFKASHIQTELRSYFENAKTDENTNLKKATEMVAEFRDLVAKTRDAAIIDEENKKLIYKDKDFNKCKKEFDKFVKKVEKLVK